VAYSAATGALLWTARYNGTGQRYDAATSVAVSPGGNRVYVTGTSDGGPATDQDYATVAYDAATGARLWVARYNGPGNGYDSAASIAVSPGGGRVFVTGYSFRGSSNPEYATVAYSAATGARLWVARFGGGGSGEATSVAVSPGGTTVLVTGSSSGAYATVAYRAATGARLWVARYNAPGTSQSSATSMAVSPGGTVVFVTGSSFRTASGFDYATVAYRASTGAQLWVRRYNGPASGFDQASSVAVSPGGSMVFVTGGSQGATSGLDYATVAYSS